MQRENSLFLKFKRRQSGQKERGVALITTLLLLMLLTGLTLAMAWSSRSDMLINGYYRNFRGSFYAADSGINIMRQAMIPLFQAGGSIYPTHFNVGTNPLPSPATEQAVMTAVNGTYGAGTITGTGTGVAANSWPGQYNGTLVFTLKSCTTNIAGSTCNPFPPAAKTVSYVYAYTITSTGKSKGTGNTVLTDSGLLTVTATIPTPSKLSFAGYGMFVDQYSVCDGSSLVPGTITGPVFTNGSWNFGTGQYTFTDNVGQNGSTVGTSSGCPGGASKIPSNVTAQQGFQFSQPKVALPQNSFNQEQAVLDGKGASADGSPVPQPKQSDLNKVLRNPLTNAAYPGSGSVPDGVYLPYTSSGGVNTFTGGGILASGNVSVTLQPTASGKGQVYKIKTAAGVTTTVTIDPASNTTTVFSSSNPSQVTTITGVPQQYDPVTGADMGYDTMLYVNGNITSLSGPGEGKAAIQDGTALTITASNNVTITGDLLYKSEPVVTGTPTNPVTPGHPLDSLTGNDTQEALGIFTASGNINLANTQSDTNLEIDASLATLSAGGTGSLINTGNAIGTLTIVGGRIQNTISNINATQRNVLFDKRFAAGNNFAPPWFPSTGIAAGTNGANLNQPVLTRLQWLNQNNYF
jgi:Tfp pilus assembly protein PilX